jgi:hypothetical protein
MLSRLLLLLILASSLSGCMGPAALNQALPAYDETVSQLQGQSLLLNIARARHHMAPHFTSTTSIAATFNFESSVGLTGNIPTSDKKSYASAKLELGTTIAENPTIELVPMRGEDFSNLMLSPLTDEKFRLIVNESSSMDMLIRLMGKAFLFQDDSGALVRTVRNQPNIPDEYAEYRRIASHLSSLRARNQLLLRQLTFVDSENFWLSNGLTADDALKAREAGYDYARIDETNEYRLSRTVIGNTVVTNVDPRSSSNEVRAALNEVIALTPNNYVDINIRSQGPGGDYPLRGAIQLRSFNEVLGFIARGIEEDPEFNVTADSRSKDIQGTAPNTGHWQKNPERILTVIESDEPPDANIMQVRYKGLYYSVKQAPWDLDAFNTLYLLLQMSTQTTPKRSFPITISK